jgi:cell division septum initiation protein DivIVA
MIDVRNDIVTMSLDEYTAMLVCAEFVRTENAQLRAQLAQARNRFDSHTERVGGFLKDLYATMVDSCAIEAMTVEQTCERLLEAAERQRQHIATLTDDLAQAREALRPFALAADDLDETDDDRRSLWDHVTAINISCGDIRQAAAAFGKGSES